MLEENTHSPGLGGEEEELPAEPDRHTMGTLPTGPPPSTMPFSLPEDEGHLLTPEAQGALSSGQKGTQVTRPPPGTSAVHVATSHAV